MYGEVILLEEETKSLGVDIDNISERSHTRVKVKCIRCDEVFLREFRNLKSRHMCSIFRVVEGIQHKWCSQCESFLPLAEFSKNKRSQCGLCAYCKKCSCLLKQNRKYDSVDSYVRIIQADKRRMCELKKVPFDLTYEHLRNMWEVQEGSCYYTRVPFTYRKPNSLTSPTLERIDPERGYLIDNVVWASRAMNLLKNDSEIGEVFEFLKQWDFMRHFIPSRIEFKLIHPDAVLPTRSKEEDAGYDLTSIQDVEIPPHKTKRVRTGVIFTAPTGFYFTVEGRSSLFKYGLVPARGIIDATYCGELLVALSNTSEESYQIKSGDRVAQIIIHRTIPIDVSGVKEFSLDYSIRGESGFGSTGR